MINYMLAPLDKHFDLGFGFTGNTFRGAAESLVAKEDKSYFGDAPISYLQRHAIELYLKSAIIILHLLNGNSIDANDNKSFPKVISNGKEKPIFNVHSISELFNHLCIELNSMEALLKEKSEICWNFSKEFKSNIQIIENNDPSSTFFRYPVTKEKGGCRSICDL